MLLLPYAANRTAQVYFCEFVRAEDLDFFCKISKLSLILHKNQLYWLRSKCK